MQEKRDGAVGSLGCGGAGDCGFGDHKNEVENVEEGTEVEHAETGAAGLKVCGGLYRGMHNN